MDMAMVMQVFPAVLALIILVDISVLWLTGRQVPELLGQLVLAVFATYFASTLSRPKARVPGARSERGETSERLERGASAERGAGAGEEGN